MTHIGKQGPSIGGIFSFVIATILLNLKSFPIHNLSFNDSRPPLFDTEILFCKDQTSNVKSFYNGKSFLFVFDDEVQRNLKIQENLVEFGFLLICYHLMNDVVLKCFLGNYGFFVKFYGSLYE